MLRRCEPKLKGGSWSDSRNLVAVLKVGGWGEVHGSGGGGGYSVFCRSHPPLGDV